MLIDACRVRQHADPSPRFERGVHDARAIDERIP
jgi:hypothetical protein